MAKPPVKIRYTQGERGWALPNDDGTFTVDNLPFCGGAVQYKDVVRTRESNNPMEIPFVARIEARTFHAWSEVDYTPATQARYTALRKAVEAKSGHTEGSVPGRMIVASNVEDTVELLAMLQGAGTGTVSVVDHQVLPTAPFDLKGLDPEMGAPRRRGPAV
jgi:hypothetical protein